MKNYEQNKSSDFSDLVLRKLKSYLSVISSIFSVISNEFQKNSEKSSLASENKNKISVTAKNSKNLSGIYKILKEKLFNKIQGRFLFSKEGQNNSLKTKDYKLKRPVFLKTGLNLGFTLVELIVVITILAILGTIAFVSFGSYSSNARDGTRISDLANISKGLEMYQLKVGSYPIPEGTILTGTINNVDVVYKGVIGDNISRNIGMSKTPLDPLDKTTRYVYGTNHNKSFFQISSILENSRKYSLDLLDTAYANYEEGYTIGNYNGYLKYSTGSNYYLVNLPSLIFNFSGSVNDIIVNKDNVYFVYNGINNLPYPTGSSNITNNINTTDIFPLITGETNTYLTGVNITSIVSATSDELRKIEIEKIFGTGTTQESVNLLNSFKVPDTLEGEKIVYTVDKMINLKIDGDDEVQEDDRITYLNLDGSLTPYLPDIASGSTRFELYTGSLSLSGVTYDKITGLYWQTIGGSNEINTCKAYDTNFFTDNGCNDGIAGDDCNWCAAKSYCANLSLGGFDDWRLPDITELLSITNVANSNCLDSNFFVTNTSNFFWSSNINILNTNNAIQINCNYGTTLIPVKTTPANIHCVR